MKQSSFTNGHTSASPDSSNRPAGAKQGLHVAIIMDGNGRWAAQRGLPRLMGHRAGAESVRRTLEAAPELGIRYLTLYAFSSDNWQRPAAEVTGLMRLLSHYMRSEAANCYRNGVQVRVIGRRDRLQPPVLEAIHAAEVLTRPCERVFLRLALDYSARDAMVGAARRLAETGDFSRSGFSRALGRAVGLEGESPEVDLLIRTSGEQRLSDFMLWECGYAELYFTPVLWPDFDAAELDRALRDFRNRDRRFGAVPAIAERQEPAVAVE
ncbi:MAG: di-trans,poly-cis-decaprenylcistransferase [Acidobacteria bacterium]|nr:di-trans,poly-cis-decaprenylcistransferase [Acidobacteriota bacterium]